MVKKSIKTILKTKEKDISNTCLALVGESCIQYVEDGFKMKIHFTNHSMKLLRKNNQYEIYFQFEKDNCLGTITFQEKGILPLEVRLKNLEITEKKIFVSYHLNEDEYEYSIYY